ncbi:hypothetical protein H0H92_001912 [Tricholoma furcatifolium]|nr:hypothetical protein H0H92_001912 [Tricholoma furcatifolium]
MALLCMVAFFPETSHFDTRHSHKIPESPTHSSSRWRFKFINPLTALWLLRSPVVLGISVSTTFILLTDFAILSPMAYTIGQRYGISNEAILGACFLPNGLGDIGRLSDIILAKSRKQRSGVWCPEDRIKGTLFSAATLVPMSVLSFGLVNRYVGGNVGLTLTLICLFINGAGVQMVLGPTAAYLIDIMPSRSAETVAAST